MFFSDETANLIVKALVSMLLLFILFDNILILVIRKKKPLLENNYFGFHRRHGFLKITMFKMLLELYIAYSLLTRSPNAGALAAPILGLGIFDIKLLIDFIKQDGEQKTTS